MRRLRDPRIWLGLAIAAACLWYAFRDVDFTRVLADMRRADWVVLLGLSVPSYVLAIYLRAVRWRHLIGGVNSAGIGPLFRATAVGFMANNIYPLRIGELVRAWHLARETGGSTSSLFGTVVVERVIDTLVFLAMAAAVLGVYGTALVGGGMRAVSSILPILAAPLLFVLALRLAPERSLSLARQLSSPLPEPLRGRALGALERLVEGVAALRGRHRFFWVIVHSLSIWLFVNAVPFVVGIVALDIEVGPPLQVLAVSYVTMTVVGIFVALPSAPGFFGVYHAACTVAFGLFGLGRHEAAALGTVVHGVFWVTLTLLGLLVLRVRHESLGELTELTEEPERLTGDPGRGAGAGDSPHWPVGE